MRPSLGFHCSPSTSLPQSWQQVSALGMLGFVRAFQLAGPSPLLRLPQVSRQKPPFAWLWNQPLGEQMRQQLDQLQRLSAHISVPGQAHWHPAKLFWASPNCPVSLPCVPHDCPPWRASEETGGLEMALPSSPLPELDVCAFGSQGQLW